MIAWGASPQLCGPRLILRPVKANPNSLNLVDLLLNKCCGSGMFIPDPNGSIPDAGSKRYRITDPDPQQRIQVFLNQKIVTKLLEI